MPSSHDSEMNEPEVGLKGESREAKIIIIGGKIRITHVHTVYPVLSLSLSLPLSLLSSSHASLHRYWNTKFTSSICTRETRGPWDLGSTGRAEL